MHPDLKKRLSCLLLFIFLAAGGTVYYLAPAPAGDSYPLDDAWIHMVYARNLAEGNGFSYNPPDQEAGFSSPLWLLVAAACQVFSSSVLLPKIAGALLLLLLALAATRLGGAAAGLFILLDPLHHFAALSGMEVILFAFFCVLGLDRVHAGKPLQAGIAAAAALWSRPEGALLAPLLLLFGLQGRFETRPWIKKAAKVAGPSVVAALIWIVFCLAVTGRPLPNTFYAKLSAPSNADLAALPELLYRFLADSGPTLPFVAPWLILAALYRRRDRRAYSALLLSAGLVLGVWATRPILLVEGFYWERYLVPALPGIYILLGIGLQRLWSGARPAKALAGALGLSVALGLCLQLEEKRDLYARNCLDIARFNVAGGRWIAGNTDPEDRIAVMDAGAFRYFGNRAIVDLAGLNDRRFTDLSALAGRVDIRDAAALAVFSGAEWLVLYARHYSGRGPFRPIHQINYNDCSLYLRPEPFTLLFLKKAQQ